MKARIYSKLEGKRRRKHKLKVTPTVAKDIWAKNIMNQLYKAADTQYGRSSGQIQTTSRKFLGRWTDQKWKERWKRYLDYAQRTPTHKDKLSQPRSKTPSRPSAKRKVQLQYQLRTAKNRDRCIPETVFPAFVNVAGHEKKTPPPKHVLIFYSDHAHHRRKKTIQSRGKTARYGQIPLSHREKNSER